VSERPPDEEVTMVVAPKPRQPLFPWSKQPSQDELDEMLRTYPEFSFQVGQLVGAGILAATQLAEHDDPQVKLIGKVLANRVAWFAGEPGRPTE
jgi:hypothetical protein